MPHLPPIPGKNEDRGTAGGRPADPQALPGRDEDRRTHRDTQLRDLTAYPREREKDTYSSLNKRVLGTGPVLTAPAPAYSLHSDGEMHHKHIKQPLNASDQGPEEHSNKTRRQGKGGSRGDGLSHRRRCRQEEQKQQPSVREHS